MELFYSRRILPTNRIQLNQCRRTWFAGRRPLVHQSANIVSLRYVVEDMYLVVMLQIENKRKIEDGDGYRECIIDSNVCTCVAMDVGARWQPV